MPLECDKFVFRKDRGGCVVFRLTVKLRLNVTKTNCRHSLSIKNVSGPKLEY